MFAGSARRVRRREWKSGWLLRKVARLVRLQMGREAYTEPISRQNTSDDRQTQRFVNSPEHVVVLPLRLAILLRRDRRREEGADQTLRCQWRQWHSRSSILCSCILALLLGVLLRFRLRREERHEERGMSEQLLDEVDLAIAKGAVVVEEDCSEEKASTTR